MQEQTSAICLPDLAARPFNLTTEYTLDVPPPVVYKAWTQQFDRWFAAPGTVLMTAEVNSPFFFETVHQDQRHPHYGRFLRLEPNHIIEITWVTGAGGTKGAETIVTVELTPQVKGTHLPLTHPGFPNEKPLNGHSQPCPMF